jgi:microcystin-dependent protein
MTLYKWSQTASSDATADSTINWAEGQAPSSVNDSARAMMAATAKYRDDIAGAIVTAGTPTAYTLSSFQMFTTLAFLNGQMIAFTPHATNAAGPVTLSVDGLGAKALRAAPNTELLAGVLIQGTPYVATYNNADGAFYLQGFFGNPYNIPLGAGMDYWLSTAPNSSFAQPFGQAISRTTYATLFAQMGTTYGVGDNSTTFNLPDLRGRVTAKNDAMGGTGANRLTSGGSGINGAAYGATGGGETQTLTAAQIPSITSSANNSITVYLSGNNTFYVPYVTPTPGTYAGDTQSVSSQNAPVSGGGWNYGNSYSGTNSISVTSNNTGGAAHPIVQPTIICNYIMRII